MAVIFRPGVKVSTPYGPGQVVAMDGHQVRVHLSAIGLLLRFDQDVLKVEGAAAPPKRAVVRAEPAGPRGDGFVRRAIDALRFGIVPASAIEKVTVGYEPLEQWTLTRLPSASGGAPVVSEVCGPFGTGKSHSMAVIRRIAEQQGHLTAHVEVNGHGISLADPAGLLFHLWTTLGGSGFDSITPFVELNVRAALKGAYSAARTLSRFERVYANHETVRVVRNNAALEVFEERLDALMACNDQESATSLARDILAELRARGMRFVDVREAVRPSRPIGRLVEERPRDFVDCLYGYATLARVAGFSGLVVTIDEFEIEYVLPGDRFDRITDLIVSLADRLGRPDDSGVPLAVFIATVGQEGAIGDLVVERLLEQIPGDLEEKRRVLRPWPAKNLRSLGHKIHQLYREGYQIGDQFDAHAAEELAAAVADEEDDAGGQVRAFIKRYVAELDARYGPPGQ